MYEKVEVCPLCENTRFSNYLVVKDHAVSGESFALTHCDNCRFLLTNPRPANSNISRYYESDNYISHLKSSKSPINLVYQFVRFFMLRQKTKWIKNLNPGKGKLLDYGCGVGSFLAVAKNQGWQTWGIEPHQKAREIASQRKLNVKENLESLNKEKFDTITLWHVLEHVQELNTTLRKLSQLLTPNGYLIIAVPNYQSFDAKHYQQHWAGYDVPRHLYHFEPSSMTQLAKKNKFHIVKVIPLKLDSFYVSILSEKYNNGSIIEALKKGYQSNIWAKKNNQNYSSLVYVLKK